MLTVSFNWVGAGIQIPSNSAKLLLSWGMGPFFKDDVIGPEIFRETYGAPHLVVHRADFHTALCALADKLGVKIITDSRVVSYDENTPSVKTADRREYTADLIVAADGVKSIARPVLAGGSDSPGKKTGFAVYRATVDMDRMRLDPDTSWLLEEPSINIWIGEDRHIMTYCIVCGKSFKMVLSHMDHSDPATWNHQNSVRDMRGHFDNWDPK
ncbi:hypothetical protein BFJ69_g7844 [Fusarium oxysporum]|uniref:FAD-binding domain-containing protein n=1 Tax=Fusarium oxysporum TaxID=5507 RepID=A0A420N4R5_FUSOX|nr:hypothetical protein BFJ69_g7844 [Fusarium oxysporum]